MSEINLTVVETEQPIQERVSLAPPTQKKRQEYVAERADLADSIKKFDEKASKYKHQGPYDYNVVSLRDKNELPTSMTPYEMLTNPLYNTVGKFLGVDTLHEWGKQYNKLDKILSWAVKKTGTKNVNRIIDFLNGASNFAPTFGADHQRIDQVHLMAKLQMAQ